MADIGDKMYVQCVHFNCSLLLTLFIYSLTIEIGVVLLKFAINLVILFYRDLELLLQR